jgi:PIN domain nuclease of toxin-antitoxin system
MVRLLLDTNALLWLSSGSVQLGPRAGAVIEAAVSAGEAAFSAISVWETAMLVRKGRYALDIPIDRWCADLIAAGLVEVPLDAAAAGQAAGLLDLHEGLADRMIAATAMLLGAQLVTSDARLIEWFAQGGRTAALDARS